MTSGGVAPLFVVGASRSGTTVLCRALAASPMIQGLNELHYFGDLCNPLDKTVLSNEEARRIAAELLARCDQPLWEAKPDANIIAQANEIVASSGLNIQPAVLFRAVLSHRAGGNARKFVIDQTPRNIFYLSALFKQFQDARAVNIVRDPRAVAYSQRLRYRKRWGSSPDMPWAQVVRVWANYHPYTAAKLWRRAVDEALILANHPRFMSISYEKLVTKPERVLRGVCEFLGVDFERGMLMVERAGSSRGENKSTDRGFAHDGVDAWRQSLPVCDAAVIDHRLKRAMAVWGYNAAHKRVSIACHVKAMLSWPVHAVLVLLFNPKRALTQVRALFSARR